MNGGSEKADDGGDDHSCDAGNSALAYAGAASDLYHFGGDSGGGGRSRELHGRPRVPTGPEAAAADKLLYSVFGHCGLVGRTPWDTLRDSGLGGSS